jgi:ribosomal protein L37AE/L43A
MTRHATDSDDDNRYHCKDCGWEGLPERRARVLCCPECGSTPHVGASPKSEDETELSDHDGREAEDTEAAENVLRDALGDEVVDQYLGDNDE